MATYPPIGDRERDAALKRITDRHTSHDDPRWSEAGSEGDDAARDVLAYLRRRYRQLPALAAADVWDELVLSAWVYWDERRRERELLHRAHRYGASLADLGSFLGIRTRQGTRDYLDRLDALLGEHHTLTTGPAPGPATGDGTTDPRARHGSATRAARGADVHAARARRTARRTRPTHQDWITTHHTRITTVLTAILSETTRIGITPEPSPDDEDPGLGDYLHWLTDDLRVDTLSTGTFGTLGLILGELRHHPALTHHAPNHGIHRAIDHAHQLRADYANLTAT